MRRHDSSAPMKTKTMPKRSQPELREARTELRRKFVENRRLSSAKSKVRSELIPGFRNRLLATIRTLQDVRTSDFHTQLYVDYLAAVTGTAHQTARRWIDDEDPGLPDLVSFATLCKIVGTDPNWMLGLTKTKLPTLRSDVDWLDALAADISRAAGELTGMRVVGDEMEPDIHPGDWVLIDTHERNWGRNGMYMIEYKGIPALRTIGTQIGSGFVLSCRNSAYGDALVKDEAHAKTIGIKLIGRVAIKISLSRI